MPADEPVDGEVRVPASRTIERVEPASEQPVLGREEELLRPEHVWVEDVLRGVNSVWRGSNYRPWWG